MTHTNLLATFIVAACIAGAQARSLHENRIVDTIKTNLRHPQQEAQDLQLWYTTPGYGDTLAGLYACVYSPTNGTCSSPTTIVNSWYQGWNGYAGLGLSRLTEDSSNGHLYVKWDMGSALANGVSVLQIVESDDSDTPFKPSGIVMANGICPNAYTNTCGKKKYAFMAVAPFTFHYALASHANNIYVLVSYVEMNASNIADKTAKIQVYKLNKGASYENNAGVKTTCVAANPDAFNLRDPDYQFWACFELVTTFVEFPCEKVDGSGNPIYTKSNGVEMVFQAATALTVEEHNGKLFFYTQVYRAQFMDSKSTDTNALLLAATVKAPKGREGGNKNSTPLGKGVEHLATFAINTTISPMGTSYESALEIQLNDHTMCLTYFSGITCGTIKHTNSGIKFQQLRSQTVYQPNEPDNLGVAGGIAILSDTNNLFKVAFGTSPQPSAFQVPAGSYTVLVGSQNEHDHPISLFGDEDGVIPIMNLLVV